VHQKTKKLSKGSQSDIAAELLHIHALLLATIFIHKKNAKMFKNVKNVN